MIGWVVRTNDVIYQDDTASRTLLFSLWDRGLLTAGVITKNSWERLFQPRPIRKHVHNSDAEYSIDMF